MGLQSSHHSELEDSVGPEHDFLSLKRLCLSAVRLVHGGEKISAAARMLGVSGQLLDNWVKAEAAGRLRDIRGKAVTAEQMEIARLKAELSRVRMERDILKKAAVYFARESR